MLFDLTKTRPLRGLVLVLFLAVFVAMTCFLIALAPQASGALEPALRKRRLEASLELELAGTVNRERLAVFKEAFKATYEALPKNGRGHLGHQAVRYLLHRFFVQQHGWSVKGLEPKKGDVFHTLSEDADLEDWAPAYLVSFLEQRMRERGVSLDDLAALAAALEDLSGQEAIASFGHLYHLMNPKRQPINRTQTNEVLSLYLITYLIGGNFSFSSVEEIQFYQQSWALAYTGWDAAQEWLGKLEVQMLGDAKDGGEVVEFAAAALSAVEIGSRYASFNSKECLDLKTTLVQLPRVKAGRVRLGDFYNMSLYSHWRLTEKAEYLDALGALDTTNVSDPLVIIPNYLGSRPNCLEATNLYAICCRNECEELTGALERSIAGPTARPRQILDLVEEQLSSATVAAPRKLAPELSARLEDIGARHGGNVILHGRLFAQWMHHAFPNECPYPHEAGTVSPLTPDEWMGKEVNTTTTEDERRKYVEESCGRWGEEEVSAEGFVALPWSHTEELLEPSLQQSQMQSQTTEGGEEPSTESQEGRRTFDPMLLGFVALGVLLLLLSPALPKQRRAKKESEQALPA